MKSPATRERMELKTQQTVQCRLEKNHMFIVEADGKETRFDIVPEKDQK
jgi:hypothetical protein